MCPTRVVSIIIKKAVWLLLDFKITEIFGYKEDAILGS
jgi:hypothetical protein